MVRCLLARPLKRKCQNGAPLVERRVTSIAPDSSHRLVAGTLERAAHPYRVNPVADHVYAPSLRRIKYKCAKALIKVDAGGAECLAETPLQNEVFRRARFDAVLSLISHS